jgi:hypothetical protein
MSASLKGGWERVVVRMRVVVVVVSGGFAGFRLGILSNANKKETSE